MTKRLKRGGRLRADGKRSGAAIQIHYRKGKIRRGFGYLTFCRKAGLTTGKYKTRGMYKAIQQYSTDGKVKIVFRVLGFVGDTTA